MCVIYWTTKKVLKIFSSKTWCTKKPFGYQVPFNVFSRKLNLKLIYVVVIIYYICKWSIFIEKILVK